MKETASHSFDIPKNKFDFSFFVSGQEIQDPAKHSSAHQEYTHPA